MNKTISIILCVIGYLLTAVAFVEYFVGCSLWVCNITLLTSLALCVVNIIFCYKRTKK